MKHTNKLIILSVLLTIILCLSLIGCQDSENESVSTDDNKSDSSSVTTETIVTTKSTTNPETDSFEETSSVQLTEDVEETTKIQETENTESTNTEEMSSIQETEETTVIQETENNEPYEMKVDDYTLIKNENGCYLTFDDVSKYQNSSSGSILAADIEFKSIKEFKDVITKGGLTDIQKSIIAGFSTDGINIKTCDFHKLYEPSIPQGCSVGSVYWSGEFYIFDISLDNDAFGDITYLTKDHYNQLYSYYENFFNNDLITITSVEDKDGTIITDYRTSSAILKNIRYTLETENKTVIIEKEYSIESPLNDIFGYIKDVPYAITLYCIDENNLYYKISLNELKEDPTDEWLLEFGLKPYIENDHEVM